MTLDTQYPPFGVALSQPSPQPNGAAVSHSHQTSYVTERSSSRKKGSKLLLNVYQEKNICLLISVTMVKIKSLHVVKLVMYYQVMQKTQKLQMIHYFLLPS